MTLNELKTIFQTVSLSHVNVKEFNFGESFEIPDDGANQYPFTFLELPYLTSYVDRRSKTVSFSFIVVNQPAPDNRDDDHQCISDCNTIGEAIITKIQNENKDIFFVSIAGVSLREFTNDNLAGMRFEFVVRMGTEFCNPDSYVDEFKR